MQNPFSIQSEKYAKYRPTYPQAFYDYVLELIPVKNHLWDCGTGNGQIASQLSPHFKQVFATDISSAQIENAPRLDNIHYSIQPAEKTNFPHHYFDCIIVAQAVHWFNFQQFYTEVNRCLTQEGVLIVVGYGLLSINPIIDKVLHHFYYEIIGEYWDKERKLIDEAYQTIPFPLEEKTAPSFANIYHWSLEHLRGYLATWSAVKHYQKSNDENPIDLIYSDLEKAWGGGKVYEVRFPVFMRVGGKMSV